jgi:hypothetical protein
METRNELSILTERLQKTLNERSKPVSDAIRQIETTGSLLDDYVAPTASLEFHNRDGFGVSLMIDADTPHPFYQLHPNAIRQIGERFGVPAGFLTTLISGSDWQKNLSVRIMDDHAHNTTRERVLLRTVNGQLRGFLSDRYRRLNSMEIFVAFLTAARNYNNVLVDAHSGETKGFLEVINPEIVEFDTPQNGRNYAVFGARIRNSDFGDGALDVRTFMLNVKCLNGLVGETMLRELHLGGRIPENIQISDDTMKKETAAKAGLVRDIMASVYHPDNVRKMIGKIENASARIIDIPAEIERLPKLGLTVGESQSVGKLLMENDPANGLDGSPTLWKLVNGMTAVARDARPERKRELEEIAGSMLK